MQDPFQGRCQASISGDDDHLDGGMALFDVLKEVEALTIRKFLVECDEVDRLGIEDAKGGTG